MTGNGAPPDRQDGYGDFCTPPLHNVNGILQTVDAVLRTGPLMQRERVMMRYDRPPCYDSRPGRFASIFSLARSRCQVASFSASSPAISSSFRWRKRPCIAM